jgi:hypothetical protein
MLHSWHFFVNSVLLFNPVNIISLVQVEYQVESCSASGMADNGCTDTKRTILTMPTGGSVIYGAAHQHSGGIGSTLYREVIFALLLLFAVYVQH